MKNLINRTLIILSVVAFVGCNENAPQSSFPKKHLIEEFTSMSCGYCPYGMDAMSEFIANDSNWILVMHHYGFAKDKFSAPGGEKIANNLHIGGAPSACVDRTPIKVGKTSSLDVHPLDLLEVGKTPFETTTYASIKIENTYNATTGGLHIHVSGVVAREDAPKLFLTVLIKESGMIAAQSDYIGSFEGWKEFRHVCAVREFVSENVGDSISLDAKGRYDVHYNTVIDDKWVPENCMVVAFLSESFKPIIQAEQKPVVNGTKGGADIQHGGITPVPVSSYYPEPANSNGPSYYSGLEADTMLTVNAYSEEENGLKYWQIQAVNGKKVITVSGTKCLGFANFYLVTAAGLDTIPYGTYPLVRTEQANTAIAGNRDDAKQLIDGSIFYYTSQSYFKQGYLDPAAQWLLTSGNVVIDADGWKIEAQSLNGSTVKIYSAAPFKYASGAPKRKAVR